MARRGILAGLAALAAGGLTKATEWVAHAANGDVLTAGNSFTETSTFQLSISANGGSAATNS